MATCQGAYQCGPGVELPCNDLVGGLDLVAAGVGMHNFGRGTLGLRGVPPTGQLLAAILVWGGITNGDGEDQLSPILFNDSMVFGTPIGQSQEPCWTGDPEATYSALWADVTLLLDSQINGDHRLELPGSSVVDGRDPRHYPPPPLMEGHMAAGASLMVIFSDPALADTGLLALHFESDLLAGDKLFRFGLPPVPSSVQRAKLVTIGGGGQLSDAEAAVASYQTLIRLGVEGQWVTLRGPNSTIDVHADWTGADGGLIQGWDTRSTDFRASVLQPFTGQDFYEVHYKTAVEPPGVFQSINGAWISCVVPIVHALSFYSWEE